MRTTVKGQKHPFVEIAEGYEARLRDQKRHDRLGTGAMLFASEGEERSARAQAAELRRLADDDIAEGWPFDG